MKPFLAGLFVMLTLGLVGSCDYADELAEQARYCENVERGVWYDSDENYKNKCKPSIDS